MALRFNHLAVISRPTAAFASVRRCLNANEDAAVQSEQLLQRAQTGPVN